MKKAAAIILASITILICGWLIFSKIAALDIPTNKNDWYAMDRKRKVDERTDIDLCEKQILKTQIDSIRANERQIAETAFETQLFAFAIIIVQLMLIVIILLFPKIKSNSKKMVD